MLKIVKKLLLLHRLAVFARSLSLASSPVILLGCVVLILDKKGWLAMPQNYTIPAILLLAGLAWIPLYVRLRGSLLSVARQADRVLEAEGLVTAGADILQAEPRPSPWSGLIEQRGMQYLRSPGKRRVVPPGRFVHFITPVLAAVIFALICNYAPPSAASNALEWSDGDAMKTQLHIFSPVDEKLLRKLHQKISEDLQGTPGRYQDAQLEELRKELKKTLSTFPKSDEELAQYISKVEKLKKEVDKLEEAEKQQQEILQQMGEKLDGKLLDELGKQLEQKDLEEAAKAAEQLAESMEGKEPSEKSMEEAAQDLAEAAQAGEEKVGGEEKKDGQEGKDGKEGAEGKEGKEGKEEKASESDGKDGEKAEGESGKNQGEGKEKADDGKGMSPEKFDKLKKTLDKLNKLAEMFNIKSPDQIPKGLKDLAKEFSDSKLSNDQMKELKDLIGKLDNLKNMMVEAKDGKGKGGKYSDLMKDFENKASGGKSKEGQPGQKGQGQPGATPQGKEMKPGEGQGEGEAPMENPGGMKGGQGKPGGPENPGDAPAAAEKEDSKKTGQDGWGDGTAPHLGDPTAGSDDVTYDDMDVEGKDSTGPLKKDVIKGAAEKGFIGKDYKNVYEEYSSIIEEIMEEENVPALYRYYVNKYFELIAPRE